MERKIIVILFILGGCLFSSAKAIAKQPNIIIYLADDLGSKDVGFNKAKVVKTSYNFV